MIMHWCGSDLLKFLVAHPLVMFTRGVSAHKIFTGAHKTSNDALKAEGGTQKNDYIHQENYSIHSKILVHFL